MSSVTLKSILGKRNEILSWLQQWSENSGAAIQVEDQQQRILFGSAQNASHSFPVHAGPEIVGYVRGNEQSAQIASLLSILLQKEAEKKKMGSEVLHYYQELNVIYNFSEKLIETIDPDAISRIALEQANHSIPSDGGMVILWDESTKQLNIPATVGPTLFNIEQVSMKTAHLLEVGLNGQSEIMDDSTVLKDWGMIHNDIQSVMYAAMKVKQRIFGAIILADKKPNHFTAAHLKLLVTLALQSSVAIESAFLYEKNIREVQQREEAILRIHEVAKKFVPTEFIRLLGKEAITDVKLGDQAEKIVTVLFTDIREFTSLSEKLTPGENFRFVSAFNERLGPVIRKHNGFINQYLGDSIMAIFPGHPENALKAAIEMQRTVDLFNEERKANGMAPIKAGIGMHTGPLIMGITGDEYRLDAATISDTVNTAARIESLTKHYQSPLLLSSATLADISDNHAYDLRFLGDVQLKGKEKLLSIVECINGYPADMVEVKRANLGIFRDAMGHYLEQRFEKAAELFQSILEKDPEDLTTFYFKDNARKYAVNGVPENWTGAERMHSK